jgi:hypothetical protein
LGDAAGERCPPKTTRTKHVPQTLNPARFGGRFGGRDWRCSKNGLGEIENTTSALSPHPTPPQPNLSRTPPSAAGSAAGAKSLGAWRRRGPFLVVAWRSAAGSPPPRCLVEQTRVGWATAAAALLPSAVPWRTGRRGWVGRRCGLPLLVGFPQHSGRGWWWAAARPSVCAMPSTPASRWCVEAISGIFRDTRAPGAAALGLTEEVASSSPERVGLRLVVVDF